MSATAAAQLRRLLALIPLCADDTSHSLEEMAASIGTDARTLLRDLYALSHRYDDPGGFVEAVQVFVEPHRFSVRSGHFRRPMRLTLRELGALALGLAVLEAEGAPEEQAAIRRARARLMEAIAALPDDDLTALDLRHAEQGAEADPEILRTVREAVRADRCLRIRYTSAAASEASARDVCPLALVPSRGRWFLLGAVEDQVRVYRLDRMAAAELLPETFDRAAAPSVDEPLSGDRIFVGEPAETVRIWYGPRIAPWIAEREGMAPAADGSVTVEYPLGDPEWALRHVLQYGPDAEVMAPEAMRAVVVDRLHQMIS